MADMDVKADGDGPPPVPPAPAPPNWARGKFQLFFASMGQGDCCVITCPNGEHIMIDCGSKAGEAEDLGDVRDWIRGPSVLNRPRTHQNQLSALILTHPDRDHINKVDYMIGGKTAVTVDAVYFSDADVKRRDFQSGPLRRYGAGKCGHSLRTYCKVKNLYCVTLNGEEELIHWWTSPFGATEYTTDDLLISDCGLRVSYGWLDADGDIDDEEHEDRDPDWEVTIIAGNVRRQHYDHSDTDGRNAASLVTLVRRYHEKVLICGDATTSTQNYLYQNFKATGFINSLTMLQVPHHGSTLTAGSKDFVGLVRPHKAVISVRSNEHTHHHPAMEVIEAYMAHTKTAAAQSPYRAWQKVPDVAFQKIRNDWEAGKVKYTPSAKSGVRRYVRNDTKGVTGEIILDKVGAPGTAAKYVLYQRETNREIRQTGHDGHQWCYLE
jgi:beta-lactamase superfamily II metal-dependent hydrolase